MARLSELAVKSAKPGRHVDGDGLMLVVSATGAKKWVLRYQAAGKRRDKGLGSYPDVSLKDARARAAEDRRTLAAGLDPIAARRAAKRAAKPVPTFAEVAALVIADAQAKSINAKVRYQWDRHLGEVYSGPLLNRPVHEITTVEVASVLSPVWRSKPEVARKLFPAIRSVFERARVILRDEHGVEMARNPANWADLKAMGFETPKELSRGHHASLPYAGLPDFIADLRSRDATSALALEFLILTSVRTNAVLLARWAEIDTDKAVWTVPLSSLKDRKHRAEAFRVPLAPRAVENLAEMLKAKVSDFVFPGQRAKAPFSNMAFLTLLKRMNSFERKWLDDEGRPITAHGFRATFRTWAEEVATVPHAVVEQAMGHKVGGKVERAYRRTDVMDLRRGLMNAWALQCSPPAAGNVVSIRRKG
jgi:integrase